MNDTPNPDAAAVVDALVKKFTDEGRIIEAGWQAMRVLVVSPTAPETQLVEMRQAYFAGAQHLFASIASIASDGGGGGEPTPEDLRRLDLIHDELEGFVAELRRKVGQQLACPDCPLCGHPPAFVLHGNQQAFCGTLDCAAMCWNPSRTAAENRADHGTGEGDA